MFKLYRAQRDAQYTWIRNHPIQYIALNATLMMVFVGYFEYKDRREERKFENNVPTE